MNSENNSMNINEINNNKNNSDTSEENKKNTINKINKNKNYDLEDEIFSFQNRRFSHYSPNHEKLYLNSEKISSENKSFQEFLNDNNLNEENTKLINDLQLKIKILANAFKIERTKNTELENQIKNLKTNIDHNEHLLNEKENLLILTTKEKYELQTKFDNEKQINEASNNSNSSIGNFIGNIFNRRDSNTCLNIVNEGEYKKIFNKNLELSIENEMARKRLDDTTEDFNRCKREYQNIINSQIEKIKKIELLLHEKNLRIDENQKKLQIMYDNFKNFDIEKTKYESSLNELIKDKKLKEKKIIDLISKSEDKDKLINSYIENIQRHEIESASLCRKLAELKNAIIESNLVISNYQGERIGILFNDKIELIFGKTDTNEYVLIIKDKNGEESINIEDVDYFKISEKYDNSLEILYLVIFILKILLNILIRKLFLFFFN